MKVLLSNLVMVEMGLVMTTKPIVRHLPHANHRYSVRHITLTVGLSVIKKEIEDRTFVYRLLVRALKRSKWHMLTRDHTVLLATHTFIHKWNEPSCLYSPAALWPVLIYFPSHRR